MEMNDVLRLLVTISAWCAAAALASLLVFG
jgi:hypothetical protein